MSAPSPTAASALQLFRDIMYPILKDILPSEYLEYSANSESKEIGCRVCRRN